MDGMHDGMHLGAPTLNVPQPKIRLDQIRYDVMISSDGEEIQFILIYPHPLLPIAIEIPFRVPYAERLHENFGDAIEQAKTIQAQST